MGSSRGRRLRGGAMLVVLISSIVLAGRGRAQEAAAKQVAWLDSGRFVWQQSGPLLQVAAARLPDSPERPWVAIKDPSIVRWADRWHLFCSLRRRSSGEGRICIGYASFADWAQAGDAEWTVLKLTEGYHGAPQVFFFEPHRTWYLIYQAEDATGGLPYGPCYSTNPDLADPNGWTLPQPLYTVKPGTKAGLDYWVIGDDQSMHLFFTTLDGRMWRAQTGRADFPQAGWSEPQVALQAEIFEASHTYKLLGTEVFLSLIEEQDGRRGRYYQAYLADSLRGPWRPLAASREQPFAGLANVRPANGHWTDSYSHGELVRSGVNERMEVDPQQLQFLFQGASEAEYQAGSYGDIPWKLGLLRLLAE